MARSIAWFVVVAACAAKPPEPLNNPRSKQRPPMAGWDYSPKYSYVTYEAAAARPTIDVAHLVPDFHDELRWPLSGMSHPNLEPRFEIAAALADPGVGWIDLCKSSAVNRHGSTGDKELLSYLRGWCSAIKGDVDAACSSLSPLVGSVTRGIGSAIKIDLANIIAAHGGADKAEHWLSKHRIRDVSVLDTLAATYVEVGMPRDAYEINLRAIDSDSRATDATKCRRLIRTMALGGSSDRIVIKAQLESIVSMAATGKAADETCQRLYRKALCFSQPASECLGYFADEGIDVRNLDLLAAYYGWPNFNAPSTQWWSIAEHASKALPLQGADELVVSAYEATLRGVSQCGTRLGMSIWHAADLIRLQPVRSPELDKRLDAMTSACGKRHTVPSATAPAAAPTP